MTTPISSVPASSALAGLQDASSRMDRAAQAVANPEAAGDTVTLSAAAVAMKMAEQAFEANARVLAAEDNMIRAITRLATGSKD